MSEDQKPRSELPMEYKVILCVAMGVSGLFYHWIAIVASYFVLKRLRPYVAWELLTVTSGYIGFNVFTICMRLLGNEGFLAVLEPVIVVSAALTLLLTRRRAWARLLAVYAVIAMCVSIVSLGRLHALRPEIEAFMAVAYALSAWLLIRWLRRVSDAERLAT